MVLASSANALETTVLSKQVADPVIANNSLYKM